MSQSSRRLHLENILDRELSLEKVLMHAADSGRGQRQQQRPPKTSARAGQRAARLAERSSSRAWKWMWLEVETNWQNGGTLAFTDAGEAANRREGAPE